MVLLKGFGFSGYRSFGDELVKISPLKKVNLIIGKNNIGKSNIVNFLANQYAYFVSKAKNERLLGREQKIPFNEIDRHIPTKAVSPGSHKIAFPVFQEDIDDHINHRLPDADAHRNPRILARKLLTSNELSDNQGMVWFVYKSAIHTGEFKLEIETEKVKGALEKRDWLTLWGALTRRNSGGELENNWIPDTIRSLSFIPPSTPKVEIIPAIRKIGANGSKASDFSGEGIIERLAKIQHPSLQDQHLKKKFEDINKFVQEVLENSSANIEITHASDMILIHMDGKTLLPLESLGTSKNEGRP